MSDSPITQLSEILEQYQPASILSCGHSAVPSVEAYRAAHPDCRVTELPALDDISQLPQSRFDLAIVADQLEHMPKPQGEQLIGRLRDLHSHHLCVLIENPRQLGWSEGDFFGLGLKHQTHFEKGAQCLDFFTYDIETYNHVRTWNNPRYWANPENFGKYWW